MTPGVSSYVPDGCGPGYVPGYLGHCEQYVPPSSSGTVWLLLTSVLMVVLVVFAGLIVLRSAFHSLAGEDNDSNSATCLESADAARN